ncbi:MAG: GNAT family N-acetyltransferase [bacterium]
MKTNKNYENAQIVHFNKDNEEHRQAFLNLNLEWLEKYFDVAELHKEVLLHPEETIIKNDGFILLAKFNDKIVGTGAISQAKDGNYELNKVCITETYRGFGLGKKIVLSLIELAKEQRIKKIYLISSNKLTSALALYKKLGFIESKENRHQYTKRADVTMELTL